MAVDRLHSLVVQSVDMTQRSLEPVSAQEKMSVGRFTRPSQIANNMKWWEWTIDMRSRDPTEWIRALYCATEMTRNNIPEPTHYEQGTHRGSRRW